MTSLYHCELCHIKTTNKRDYNTHLITQKHGNRSLDIDLIECSKCGKKYKSRQGLWKHRKYGLCAYIAISTTTASATTASATTFVNNELVNTLIKQNQEFKEMLLSYATNMGTNVSSANVSSANVSVKFNIGDFLNKTCIHAINITDFIHSITWTIEDIEYLGNCGCVDSTTKIINDALNKLDPYCRPIWCSDEKRLVFYIKNVDNILEKDGDLIRTINRIKHCSNQISAFNSWKLKYPGCKESGHGKNDLLIKISVEMFDMNPDNIRKIVIGLANKTKINKGIEADGILIFYVDIL